MVYCRSDSYGVIHYFDGINNVELPVDVAMRLIEKDYEARITSSLMFERFEENCKLIELREDKHRETSDRSREIKFDVNGEFTVWIKYGDSKKVKITPLFDHYLRAVSIIGMATGKRLFLIAATRRPRKNGEVEEALLSEENTDGMKYTVIETFEPKSFEKALQKINVACLSSQQNRRIDIECASALLYDQAMEGKNGVMPEYCGFVKGYNGRWGVQWDSNYTLYGNDGSSATYSVEKSIIRIQEKLDVKDLILAIIGGMIVLQPVLKIEFGIPAFPIMLLSKTKAVVDTLLDICDGTMFDGERRLKVIRNEMKGKNSKAVLVRWEDEFLLKLRSGWAALYDAVGDQKKSFSGWLVFWGEHSYLPDCVSGVSLPDSARLNREEFRMMLPDPADIPGMVLSAGEITEKYSDASDFERTIRLTAYFLAFKLAMQYGDEVVAIMEQAVEELCIGDVSAHSLEDIVNEFMQKLYEYLYDSKMAGVHNAVSIDSITLDDEEKLAGLIVVKSDKVLMGQGLFMTIVQKLRFTNNSKLVKRALKDRSILIAKTQGTYDTKVIYFNTNGDKRQKYFVQFDADVINQIWGKSQNEYLLRELYNFTKEGK